MKMTMVNSGLKELKLDQKKTLYNNLIRYTMKEVRLNNYMYYHHKYEYAPVNICIANTLAYMSSFKR